MSRIAKYILLFLGFSFIPALAYAKDPKPLFSDDATIKIRLEAPFGIIMAKAERSTDPYSARLTLIDAGAPETHTITLAARGNSRRNKDNCRFPPLRIRFGNKESGHKPSSASLFKGQKSLKLVTHCNQSKKYQQYTLLEFAAYRILNILTEDSLHVRLATIDYVDDGSGKSIIKRTGFFIEDMDDAARRTDRKELDVPAVNRSDLDGPAAARTALFQYMISNLDWSMLKGLEGTDCCHNTKLMGPTDANAKSVVPVPYDFDQSGLVSADYALPPANIPVRKVTTRVYRGYCRHNSFIKPQVAIFVEKRSAILAVLDGVPDLETGHKKRTKDYMDRFYEALTDPEKLDRKILKKCL